MLYIYQSCLPVATFTTKKTQIIQTQKVSVTDYSGLIFKDSSGVCWTYLGEFDDLYIPPTDYFTLRYQGNYFETSQNLNPIFYPDCDYCELTSVSACTETYFVGEKCEDKSEVIVKACNVGPTVGNLKLLPSLGDICGVSNPNGDDFCVTIKSFTTDNNTEFTIVSPAWKSYDCDSCPTQKIYSVSSFDGLYQNLKVYAPNNSTTLMSGTSINLNTDNYCYFINSYEGIKVNYLYDSNVDPTINQTFTTSADCAMNYYQTLI